MPSGSIAYISGNQWIDLTDIAVDESIADRCTVPLIQAALDDIPGAQVKSVSFNRTGRVDVPENPAMMMPAFTLEGVPDYCEVIVLKETNGTAARVVVRAPFAWNGRFLGTAGGGNRTTLDLMPLTLRLPTLADGARNGFVVASTDGGVGGDPRMADWQFNESTGEHDEELITNWVHRSTHEMTVIGKAVTHAIYGREPSFSYLAGASGGGRQTLAHAMFHPEDYDGLWSADPAINWTRFIPAEMWPPVVMNNLDNPLSPSKLRAFQTAALEFEAMGKAIESFDPHSVVGRDTEAGPITEKDAEVMALIWDGPRTPAGEQLWFGLRPGIESWDQPECLCGTIPDALGNLQPLPFIMGQSWFATWLMRDPNWNWQSLSLEEYAELFQRGVDEFARVAVDDPDLSAFRDAGGKLLLTHGAEDQLIFTQGTEHYFNRVLETLGGQEEVDGFARFFRCTGDAHAAPGPSGNGVDLATGMVALMNWVEQGQAPDELPMRSWAEAAEPDDYRVAPRFRRGPTDS